MLKTIDDFRMQILNKVKCLGLIKPIMATKINSLNRKIRKNPPHEIVIQDKKDDEKSQNIVNYDVNNKIQIKDSIVYYYQKKKVVNFVSTNEKQFMSSIFWNRVHEYIISSTALANNWCKYKICQVKQDNDSSLYLDAKTSNDFVKESRFSYIRPIDGATRLIVYNISNITGFEQIVHRGSKVIVVVPDECMIIFTNYTIHAGVKTY